MSRSGVRRLTQERSLRGFNEEVAPNESAERRFAQIARDAEKLSRLRFREAQPGHFLVLPCDSRLRLPDLFMIHRGLRKPG